MVKNEEGYKEKEMKNDEREWRWRGNESEREKKKVCNWYVRLISRGKPFYPYKKEVHICDFKVACRSVFAIWTVQKSIIFIILYCFS